MKVLPRSLAFPLAVLAATVVPSGCIAVAAAAAGGAGVAYVMGEFEGTLEATPPAVVKAARKALDSLDIEVVSHESSGVDGRVEGKTALAKKVVITVEREGEKTSKVGIRVDRWGDEALSRDIYERIKTRL